MVSKVETFETNSYNDIVVTYSCLRILSPKVIIPLVPHAFQHGPLPQPALKNFFENNLNLKGFHKVRACWDCTWHE